MKIGIDTQTTLGQKTGFGFYVDNLIKNLERIDRKNKYYFFKPNKESDLSTPQRFIWDQFKIPQKAREKKVDILHQTCFSAPVLYRGKIVVTVNDLIARLFGKDIPFYSRMFFGTWMPFSYRFADKIIAISHHTKKDIVKLLKVNPDKITVIPLAASSKFKPIKHRAKIEMVKRKYHTGEKYLLHIGTLNPRKNLEFLIKVFNNVLVRCPNYHLVITGKKGWYYEGLFKLVKELGLTGKVIFTGYVQDEDAPYLYNGADIFVFPSLYEGFGLPPLEAMACGIPVISSNTSSLPEVIGKAGILLPPDNNKLWTEAIAKVLTNKKIYQDMVKSSLLQAKKFSWRVAAEKTLQVYEELYENSH